MTTSDQVADLRHRVEVNAEHIGPLAKPLIAALTELQEMRRMIPDPIQTGPVICKER